MEFSPVRESFVLPFMQNPAPTQTLGVPAGGNRQSSDSTDPVDASTGASLSPSGMLAVTPGATTDNRVNASGSGSESNASGQHGDPPRELKGQYIDTYA